MLQTEAHKCSSPPIWITYEGKRVLGTITGCELHVLYINHHYLIMPPSGRCQVQSWVHILPLSTAYSVYSIPIGAICKNTWDQSWMWGGEEQALQVGSSERKKMCPEIVSEKCSSLQYGHQCCTGCLVAPLLSQPHTHFVAEIKNMLSTPPLLLAWQQGSQHWKQKRGKAC